MNNKVNAEAVLEDQELIAKFLKETTLFLGPDPEIMQSHDIMPITDHEVECLEKYTDSHQMASIRDRMQSACDESYEMLEQMGAAPGAKWGDVITGIYSASGDLTIGSAGGVLVFSVLVHHPIKFIIKNWINEPTVGVRQGDGFIHNDSRYGNIHNTDQSMIMPIFHEGKLVCWVASTVHEGENGAIEPGGMPSMAESPFDEGLKMSPFRVVENYEIKKDILTFLQNSVREPKLQYEDMKVKLYACMRLEKRINEILSTDGPGAITACLRSTNDNVMTEVRRRITEWPDMTVRTYGTMDGTLRENALIKVNCTLTKKGNRLIFDFTGSSPEISNRAINTALPGAKGMVSQVFLNHIWPDMPRGQACFAPIEFITPPCSVVNASVDAPNSQSLMAIFLSFAVAQQAVAKFLYSVPVKYTRVIAPWYNMISTFIWGGVSQHGEMLGNLCADLNGMGGGARMDMDGEHSLAPIFAAMADIGEQEMNEEDVPFLQLVSKKMTRNTQAPGKYRGGMGYTQIVATKDSDMWGFMTTCVGSKAPSIQGLFGGYACGTYPLCKVEDVDVYDVMLKEPEKFKHSIEETMNEQPYEDAKYTTHHMGLGFSISNRGELYMISQGSGGGYGDPLERDPFLVIKDIEENLITPDWARKLYHVAFDDETLIIDEKATDKLRADYREQRKRQGLPYAEFVKKHVKSEPPKDIPFYGSWNSDMSVVYAGSNDDKRDPQNPGPIYFAHPKDVENVKLEAELESVRKEAGIPPRDNRK
ncbi:MAG: acetone carboxylase subunit alpha [Gammaproteobacteria bacterium]|jgi:acetone carboxylase, alpha subunit|nr:acetone carboxylase subunit alpha [Gammaproteobacteria bacterium]